MAGKTRGSRIRIWVAGLVLACLVLSGGWLVWREYEFRRMADHADDQTSLDYWHQLDRNDSARRLRFIERMIATGHHETNGFLRHQQIELRLELGRHGEALEMALNYMDRESLPPISDAYDFAPATYAFLAIDIASDMGSEDLLRVLERAQERLIQYAMHEVVAWQLHHVARVYLELGDADSALALLQQLPFGTSSLLFQQAVISLQADIAAAQGRWSDAEELYSNVEQHLFPRAYQDGAGSPEITRPLIMRDLEGSDYQHGEPSYPLAMWIDARFGVLEGRDAQNRCEGYGPGLAELETALSYHIEEIGVSLRGAETLDAGFAGTHSNEPSEWTLMYRRDMAIALLRRAAVRDGLDLNYFAAQDRARAAHYRDQLGEDLRFEIRRGFPACLAQD